MTDESPIGPRVSWISALDLEDIPAFAKEFRNIGVGDVWHTRSKRLDEAIRLFRHLWSGAERHICAYFGSTVDDFVPGMCTLAREVMPALG